MSAEPKILASISGGKDSLAALITHIESGGRCDGAVYCRIMFDDETIYANGRYQNSRPVYHHYRQKT